TSSAAPASTYPFPPEAGVTWAFLTGTLLRHDPLLGDTCFVYRRALVMAIRRCSRMASEPGFAAAADPALPHTRSLQRPPAAAAHNAPLHRARQRARLRAAA